MATLSAAERARLPDRAFAYIDSTGKRRLPIHDESHVRNALARFERVRFEDDEARERARRRLLRAAARYGISPIGFVDGQLRSERRARAFDPSAFPTGTVTFLMTDIEGSTGHVHRLGARWAPALRDVRAAIRNAARRGGGVPVDAHGDETLTAFVSTSAAVEAAVDIQRALRSRAWDDGIEVRVRAGLHRGRPTLADGGYVGLAVHTVARVCAAGHGGQVVVTQAVRSALRGSPPPGVELIGLGRHHLAGLPRPVALYQLRAKGLRTRFPAPRTGARRA